MSTVTFPLFAVEHSADAKQAAAAASIELAHERTPGHNGELAFRRHVVAVYMGYMAGTILICSFYMFFVWLYFQLQ